MRQEVKGVWEKARESDTTEGRSRGYGRKQERVIPRRDGAGGYGRKQERVIPRRNGAAGYERKQERVIPRRNGAGG